MAQFGLSAEDALSISKKYTEDTIIGEGAIKGNPGKDGADGKDGKDGKSAYQAALDNGFIGTEVEWLESLKGDKGDKGEKGDAGEQGMQGIQGLQGEKGEQGEKGDDGKSAYQYAQDGGYIGTETEFTTNIARSGVISKELEVERARINNLTTLQDGSTTGDAELIDARIDKDGNTHVNVGKHIRTVTSQLSSEIAYINKTTEFEKNRLFNKSENTENSVAENYYLLGNGCAKWDNTGTHCLDRISVVAGETLYLNLPNDCEYVFQWQDRMPICEKESDLDNRVIGEISKLAVCGYITVPAGATSLIVSRLKTSETIVQRPVYVDEALTNTEQIIDDFYSEDVEIQKVTSENWNLSTYGNGTIESDTDYVIDRYDLGDSRGLYVYLDISKDGDHRSKYVYQWQNTIACEDVYNRLDGRVIGTPQSKAFKGLLKVPNGASALIIARKKTAPENTVICKKKKEITIEDSKYIMDKAVAVSDTWKYTVGDGTQMVIDESRAMVYVLYNTDTSGYGESHRILALSVFPLKQPWRAKFFEIVKISDTIGDYIITHMQDENILMMDNAVRIFVDAEYTKDGAVNRGWLYIDFDKVTMTCEGNFHQVKCTASGVTSIMSADILRTYIESKGYTTTDNYYVTLSSNLNKYNVWYAMITGGECEHPVFAVSADNGATWILKGVLPITANFEAMCANVDGNIYAWVRPPYIAHETAWKMCISRDDGDTFTTFDFKASSNTRGQMLTYKGKLLIAHSGVNNSVPTDACVNTRNNMTIWLGSGEKLSGYSRMIDFVNKYGILYYAIREYRGVLYMAYVSNDLYMSDGAKNLIYFTKIGELFTDGSPNEYM